MKLLWQDAELTDDCVVTAPMDLQLTICQLSPAEDLKDMAFVSACAGGHVEKVEQRLRELQDPDARPLAGRHRGTTGLRQAADARGSTG